MRPFVSSHPQALSVNASEDNSEQVQKLTGSYRASESGVDRALTSPNECTPPCTSLPIMFAAAFGFGAAVPPCAWSNRFARFARRSCSSVRPAATPFVAGVVGRKPLSWNGGSVAGGSAFAGSLFARLTCASWPDSSCEGWIWPRSALLRDRSSGRQDAKEACLSSLKLAQSVDQSCPAWNAV